MPNNGEGSSLIASAKFIERIIEQKEFHSNFLFNDNLKQRIVEALNELIKSKHVRSINSGKEDIYEDLFCIDGSIITIPVQPYGEQVGIQIGAAALNTEELFKIKTDSFGNPNPFQVARLFNNDKSLAFSGLLPSKNVYFYEQNKNSFLSLKESFVYGLNNLYSTEIAIKIKENFLNDIMAFEKINLNKNISEVSVIKEIIKEIREDNLSYNTQKEAQRIMLLSENILAQYLLNEYKKQENKSLIVLDGRLHNQDIGEWLKKINEEKIDDENLMLVGVQKTGMLNQLLSTVHEIIKSNELDITDKECKKILDKYNNGKSVFFILNKSFKTKCGLPDSNNKGLYGQECMYISEAPNRKEFVFTLPTHLFDANFNIFQKQKVIFQSLLSVFENTNTELYFNNKGVLLANVLAHENVSLNKRYTGILGGAITVEDTNVDNIITKKNKL